ncbi:hypothetical protein BFL37_00865 [Clavibacter michiganensis]|uniref:Uncharacterized protein n=1 Tax=Clavibacter michiganensis TaxID=28447 RepID=A0A251YUF8_9MICO|nr:hypothetical protein BFL37_00865 [Clavibacter michiganensis]
MSNPARRRTNNYNYLVGHFFCALVLPKPQNSPPLIPQT